MVESKKKASGYDKYIDWRLFAIPLGVLVLLLIIPTPKSMLDVGVEYALGPKNDGPLPMADADGQNDGGEHSKGLVFPFFFYWEE